MHLIQPTQLESSGPCPYLPGHHKRYEYFLAEGLNAAELDQYLGAGWRKFGIYFFRPACPSCWKCTPLRITTADFSPSRSQRRTFRRNADVQVSFGPLRPNERAFAIYRNHSRQRFSREAELDDFLFHFYLPSCPSLQVEIRLDTELIGVGFLDRGKNCLSSTYFCFDPRHQNRQLGTFSILSEIAYARDLGLPYYHLGYYVPGCRSMEYKGNFRPREYLDRQTGEWQPAMGHGPISPDY
jgi:leucyl-tRNA---protein transferase